MVRRVGEAAYELELLEGSRIHNVFHVLYLKKVVGKHVTMLKEPSSIDKEGKLILKLDEIINVKEKLRSHTVKEFLVRWKDLLIEDATSEGEQILEHPSLQLLEGKQFLGREDCNVSDIIK